MKAKRREISLCAGRPFTRVKGKKNSACSARKDGGGGAFGRGAKGRPAVTVEFKADATVVQEIPAAFSERLVDQDAGKCLRFGRQTDASARDYSDTPTKSVGVNAKRERPATTRAGGARYIVP